MRVKGNSVDDGRDESGIGKYRALSDDLKQQFRSAMVDLGVA
jgi:hypothetical protein